MVPLVGLLMWLGGPVASAQTLDSQIDSLSALVPEPVFAVGTTVVNVHFANLDQRPCKDVTLVLTPFMGMEQERYSAEIDAATSTAVFSLELKGTGLCHLTNDAIPHTSDIYLAPGETVEVCCDMREVFKRERQLNSPGPVLNMIPVTTDGHYADVNNHERLLSDALTDVSDVAKRHYSAAFSSSEEAASALLDDYWKMCKAVVDEPGSDMQKALKILRLRLSVIEAAGMAGKIMDKVCLQSVFEAVDVYDVRLLFLGAPSVIMAAFAVGMHKEILPDCPLVAYYEKMTGALIQHI